MNYITCRLGLKNLGEVGKLDGSAAVWMKRPSPAFCKWHVCFSCPCYTWGRDKLNKSSWHWPLIVFFFFKTHGEFLHGSLPEDRRGCGFSNELCETEPAFADQCGHLEKAAGKDSLQQGFSAVATALMFRTRSSLCVRGCPVPCRRPSSIPSLHLHPLDASSNL